jgi:nitrate reductase cytochrome c-type subunit
MNDYSDIIFLMGAMIIFSLLTLQTTRTFQLNDRLQMNGELEYSAISMAQDQVDKMRWIQNQTAFNNYVSNFPQTVPHTIQGNTLNYDVDVTTQNIALPNSNVSNQRVTVTVTNDYLKTNQQAAPGSKEIKLEFLKSF